MIANSPRWAPGVVHCYTSATFSYLDRARVLAESLKRLHPSWQLWLCLPDREPAGFVFDPGNEAFDNVVRLEELGIANLQQWTFAHDLVELCTAVKGAMLHRLLTIEQADKVMYLDPDIAVFNPLTPVCDLLDRYPVVLTPHLTEPEDAADGIENELSALRHGSYNLGFLAVRGCAEGRRFASWWRDRLITHCYDDTPNGLFTDQRWCDLVPSLFETAILRDPGYNVASWNLRSRRLRIDAGGMICAGDRPLRFYHFTKVTSVGATLIERNTDDPTVFELVKWYRERLAHHSPRGVPAGWWRYGAYDDGAPIPRSHRLAYRSNPALQRTFSNPFASGADSLANWCRVNEVV